VRLGKGRNFANSRVFVSICKLFAVYIACWIDRWFESLGNSYLLAYNLYIGQAWIAYWLASSLFDLSASFCLIFFDLSVEPSFDSPFLSSSFADFWGKRWNLVISNLLRDAIYIPTQNATSSRLLAVFFTFLTSAIMHELLFYYASNQWLGIWFEFFFVQGLFVIIESILFERKWIVKGSLAWRIIVIVCMLATGKQWFMEPLYKSGASIQVRNLIVKAI
jgi:hypothetical protein